MTDAGERKWLDVELLRKVLGQDSLDKVLEMISHPEYRVGKSFLLYGPPGEGRELVAYKYARMLLERGNEVTWITTNQGVGELKESFSGPGGTVGVFPFNPQSGGITPLCLLPVSGLS